MRDEIRFQTEYLNNYLEMVEDTESPRIFHIWSAVFAVAAALGRRAYFPLGTFDVYPNHYILLVGTPGTRKTTASNLGKKILKGSTGVRFAPSDTGFQRQGLILALQGDSTDTTEFVKAVEYSSRENSIASLTQLEEITNIEEADSAPLVDVADKHHMAIVASEFSRVVGQNNMAIMDFLGSMYDSEDYEYQTKTTLLKLENALLNMIACTTPISIANSLPPQAGGQGFLSRVILFYGARKYKKVARPKAPPVELVGRVKDVIANIYDTMSGAFSETAEAEAYCTSHYDYNLDIADSRFAYYAERRFTHLLKLGMCLAAARGTMVIERQDFEEAHRILRATERGMPDALGEFGMNPLAMLKQEILEQLRANQGPLSMEQIVAMFHRDARGAEISEVINDLLKTGQLRTHQLKTGQSVLSAVYTKQNTEDAMMHLLAETIT